MQEVSSITSRNGVSFDEWDFGDLDGTMRNAFPGWQRKAGIMMLVVSLLLLAGWGRSQIRSFGFQLPIGKDFHLSVQSEHEDLVFRRFQTLKFPSKYPPRPGHEPTIFKFPVELNCLFVPYFCLIAPLTICSVLLLCLSFSRSNFSEVETSRADGQALWRRWGTRRLFSSFMASTVVVGGAIGIVNRNGWWNSEIIVELNGPFVVQDAKDFRFSTKNNAYADLFAADVSIVPAPIPNRKDKATVRVFFHPKGPIDPARQFNLRMVVWDSSGSVMRDHREEVEDGRAQVLTGPQLMLSFEMLPGHASGGELEIPLTSPQVISRIRIEVRPG